MSILISRRGLLRAGTYAGATMLFAGCKEVIFLRDNNPPLLQEWATGGTASMIDKATYPDPFAQAPTSCVLLCETTAGPCTTTNTPTREDVSEGVSGLPVRLALKFVNEACAPVAGASVEIWHTHRKGVYSGQTPALDFCSNGDPEAPLNMSFRGVQVTDATGRVNFDTCFPGWYPGRAIHIHFRVTIKDQTFATSQLFFDELLTSEIFATHPEYEEFGQPDTTQETDGVLAGANDLSDYTLDVAQMTDRVMLASKVITLRANSNQATCNL
jgi:protocatechuate 3,4-dioxygenase beta subunit